MHYYFFILTVSYFVIFSNVRWILKNSNCDPSFIYFKSLINYIVINKKGTTYAIFKTWNGDFFENASYKRMGKWIKIFLKYFLKVSKYAVSWSFFWLFFIYKKHMFLKIYSLNN